MSAYKSKSFRKLWMPITKAADGDFVGILSDTSMDRDNEFMSRELLINWAKNKVLPALADHSNKMDAFVGGWRELRIIEKDGHTALVAKPFFFSKEANPLAAQIEKLVQEAVENGLNPGISIGAIPSASMQKEVNGQMRTVFTEAELVEATWVPIQSNRNATFGHVAKSFNLDSKSLKQHQTKINKQITKTPEEDEYVQKPEAVESCVSQILADPDFKPEEGRTREESAWAICQARVGKKCTEVKKMSEEQPEVVAPSQEPVEEKSEEVKEEAVSAAEEGAKESEESKVIEEQKKKIAELQKEIEELNKKAVLKATADAPEVQKEVEVELTTLNMLKATYGLLNK